MAQGPTAAQVAELLAAIGVIAFAALAVGALARRLGQPAVIGEMLLGVLAGPTVLHGALGHAVIAPDMRPLLGGVANLGLALFMFLVGLELEPTAPPPQSRVDRRASITAVATVALGAVALPAALGGALGLHLAGRIAGPQRLAFVIFIATAMSVTAFPVLVRILRERGIEGSTVGQLALRSAAVSDVAAWVLLAVALLVGRAHSGPGLRAATVVPYAAAMTMLVRPTLRRFEARGRDRQRLGVAVLAGALCSGALTSWMGLHPAFGAFLFGAIVPREAGSTLRAELERTLGPLVMGVLVPVYFVTAGLSINATTIDLGTLAIVVGVAAAGKLLGTFVAALRVRGLTRDDAATLAVLMNTRGITELVVLGVGLQAGVIGARTYALMVAMALITTAATGPVLSALERIATRRQLRYTIPARSSAPTRSAS